MPLPRTELAELLGQLANLQCVWDTDAQPALGMSGGPRAWIKLTLMSYDAKGDDDYRQLPSVKYPNQLDSVITGYRQFVVSCKARSLESDLQAYDILERVRWRLGSFTARTFLTKTKTAIVTFSKITTYNAAVNGHAALDAVFDITFAGLGGGIPTDDNGGTIGTVDGGLAVPVTLKP